MIKRKKYQLQSALLVAFILSMSAAYAATNQPAPDAGTVLKDIERNQEKKQLDLPKTDEGIKGKKEKTGTKVKIKSFEFKGNDSVTTEELEKVVAKYIGQELTVDDLQELPVILNAYYREKGWLSDITLPNQDVTNGIVRFNVVEAKFGGADLALQPQDSGYYVNPSIVKGIVDSHMGSDKKLNLKALDRALLIANDLPGVSVKGVLQAGKKSGETDVAVSIKNKPRFTSVVSTDNYGARSTGRARLLGDFTYSSPLRLGDKLNLSLLKTEGVEYGRLSYNVPFGNNGLTVGVNGSFLQYEVVSRDLGKSSHVRGFSKSAGLEARYPVIRTQSTNLYANTNYDFKHFKNKSDNLESQSEYNVNTFTIGLTGDHFDQFILNGASNNASLQLTSGNNQKNTSDGSHGRFNKLNWNYNRNQFVITNYTLNLRASGQFSDSNLDSSQKFYIGGASGVRAYPSSEGSGSSGYLVNLELKRDLPMNFAVSGFYDIGHVKQFEDLGSNTLIGQGGNVATYKGVGAQLSWQGPYQSSFSGIVARRIGENPNPTSTGNDQDGTKRSNVVWVNGAIVF
jgi:hemolysin activation/secretion protein